MITALVTAIGSFSANAVIDSLKRHGLRVLGCDIYPKEWIAEAFDVDQFFQIPQGTDIRAYLHALQDICLEQDVRYILPLTDVEIDTLNDNRSWFAGHGITICISPKETIDVCRDKMATYRKLLECGLDSAAIPTVSAAEHQSIDEAWFPVVCKPYNGRSSQGLERFSNRESMRAFFDTVDPRTYLIQPIVPGAVVTVDILRTAEGETIAAVPREELLRTLSGAGTSVRVFHDAALEPLCMRLADAFGVQGCVNFEFILTKNGEYRFLECNPRFSGGVKFSCMTGYDFVWNHLNCYRNLEIEAPGTYSDCYIARRYEEYVTSVG